MKLWGGGVYTSTQRRRRRGREVVEKQLLNTMQLMLPMPKLLMIKKS